MGPGTPWGAPLPPEVLKVFSMPRAVVHALILRPGVRHPQCPTPAGTGWHRAPLAPTKLGAGWYPSGCAGVWGPGWAGERGQQEPHQVQQVQSPAPGEEQAQAPARAGATRLESSLAEKVLVGTKLSTSKGGQGCPGLPQEERGQQGEGGDPHLRGLGLFSLETRRRGGISSTYIDTCREGAERTGPGSSRWCPEATGPHWNTGGSL